MMLAFLLQGGYQERPWYPLRGKDRGHEEDKPVNHRVFSGDQRGSIKIIGLHKSMKYPLIRGKGDGVMVGGKQA